MLTVKIVVFFYIICLNLCVTVWKTTAIVEKYQGQLCKHLPFNIQYQVHVCLAYLFVRIIQD